MNPTTAGGAGAAKAANEVQRRISILRAVARHADSDEVRRTAETLGEKAARGLKRQRRAQVTGLENAANSALKTSDVFDYIKLRTARHKEWAADNWGPDLLNFLTGAAADGAPSSSGLRAVRGRICTELEIKPDSEEGLQVYVLLIREFVRQFSAEYEYRCERLEPTSRTR